MHFMHTALVPLSSKGRCWSPQENPIQIEEVGSPYQQTVQHHRPKPFSFFNQEVYDLLWSPDTRAPSICKYFQAVTWKRP